MDRFGPIFSHLDDAIIVENKSRIADGLPLSELIGETEIRILGQMALFMADAVASQIRLFATQDVDAVVTGGRYGWVAKAFSALLEAEGLELDLYAEEVWLPPGATFTEVYKGTHLKCLRLDPIPTLVSKAIKAPEKNKILVRQALMLFPQLREQIELHGGNLAFFEDDE